MTSEIIEVESREVAPFVPQVPSLFGTTEPKEIMARAEETANILMQKVRSHQGLDGKQDLVANVQGKEYVCVGGWTLLGSLLGVFPVLVWTREVMAGGSPCGWEARVEARTLAGAVVGAAEAECLRSEKRWGSADDYALRSMAQTRATSKALRMPLGFIANLAGFEGTPSEEMPREGFNDRPVVPKRASSKPPECPEHGSKFIKFIPPGVSKKTQNAYKAFWTCRDDCDQGRNGKPYYIDHEGHLKNIGEHPDDVPNE